MGKRGVCIGCCCLDPFHTAAEWKHHGIQPIGDDMVAEFGDDGEIWESDVVGGIFGSVGLLYGN